MLRAEAELGEPVDKLGEILKLEARSLEVQYFNVRKVSGNLVVRHWVALSCSAYSPRHTSARVQLKSALDLVLSLTKSVFLSHIFDLVSSKGRAGVPWTT